MAYALEAVGQMIMNVGLFSLGMALAIVGLILGITRSGTKNKDHWALAFASFSWAIALVIPNVWFSSFIFGTGAFALSLAFMPILRDLGDRNIATMAIIAGILNLLLLSGTGAYNLSLNWQNNMDSSLTDINNILGTQKTELDGSVPEYKLCRPNELNPDGTECTPDSTSGNFVENLFVPFASILTIGTYLGKFIAFVGMVMLAPLVLTNSLANQGYFQNVIILFLMGLVVSLWQIAIFYKLVRFIFGNYGMKS